MHVDNVDCVRAISTLSQIKQQYIEIKTCHLFYDREKGKALLLK